MQYLVRLTARAALPATHALRPVRVDPAGCPAIGAGHLGGVLTLALVLGVRSHAHSLSGKVRQEFLNNYTQYQIL